MVASIRNNKVLISNPSVSNVRTLDSMEGLLALTHYI